MISERLKRPYLYLPGSFDYKEITAQLENFCQAMGYGKLEKMISVEEEIAACEKALEKAHEVIGDTAVAIDYLYHPRPLGLAKLLLTHGFRVIRIYLDSISPEEKAEFEWLKEHAPDLQLIATIQVKMRVLPRTSDEKYWRSDRRRHGLQEVRILSIWYRAAVFTDLTGSAGRQSLWPKHLSKKKTRKIWLCEKDGGVKAVYETILSNHTNLYSGCIRCLLGTL